MIDPNRFYSLLEVQKISKIKSRQYLSKYIDEGKLTAIIVGEEKDAGRRYAIKGEWITPFLEWYKSKNRNSEKYWDRELKLYLKKAVDYCELNNIKTVEELKEII
jgi:hypothetical protein